MTEVGYTASTGDTDNPATEVIVARTVKVGGGAVVNLHDSDHPNTAAALPGIAAGLRGKHLCPGRLVRTEAPNPHAPPGMRFNASAAPW